MTDTATRPVGDTIAKVDNELAVGEDLEFQRRWWVLERWVWRFFALLVVCDLIGIFGRGPLAHARARTPDHTMSIQYDRVERFSTPSVLTIHYSPAAVAANGQVQLTVSASLVQRLGNQRVSPEPATTTTTSSGLVYTFRSQPSGGEVQFALQPARIGPSHLSIGLIPPGGAPEQVLHLSIFVMP